MLRKGLLLLLILIPAFARSQEIALRHFTEDEGLPSNMVYSIMQDSKGYMWFSTDKGLARYNGRAFENFTSIDGMPGNEVFGLREDYQGRLWLAGYSGELCYYKNGAFHRPGNTPWLKLPFRPNIQSSWLQPDSSICMVLFDKKFIEVKNDQVRVIALPEVPGNPSCWYILSFIRKTKDKGYQLHANRYDIDIDSAGRLLRYIYYERPARFSYTANFSIKHTQEYLVGRKGIYDLDKKPLLMSPQPPAYSDGRVVCGYHHGGYFTGLGDGDLLFNGTWIANLGERATMIQDDIHGNVWISTRGNGLFCLSPQFRQISTRSGAFEGQIIAARLFGDTLLFGTKQGHLYQLAANRVTRLSSKPLFTYTRQYIAEANVLFTNRGDYVLFSGLENFILKRGATTPGKLDIDWRLSTIKQVFQSGDNIFIADIWNIKKLLYPELHGGRKLLPAVVKAHPEQTIERLNARAFRYRDSTIWLSQKARFTRLKDTATKVYPRISRYNFTGFLVGNSYLTGITSQNELIVIGDFEGSAVADTVRVDNCAWNQLYQLDTAHILLTTNNYYRVLTLLPEGPGGRPRFTIKTIEHPFIPAKAEYILPGSEYCFFFKKGTVTKVHTSVFYETPQAPRSLFTSVMVRDKQRPAGDEITLSYNDARNLHINFDNISFEGQELHSQYSVSNNETDEWLDIEGNQIVLNSPDYGNYTVKVRSKTLSSAYSGAAVLKLVIEKPYWATWWFIGLCATGVLGITWIATLVYFRRKIRREHKRHEADMKYQQSEYKALNALMNPHFIFNSLNNIQGLINKDEKRTANEFLVIFSDMIRQNMHNISKGFISLQQELNLIENYLHLEKLRFKDLINYKITVGEEVDTEDIKIPPLMIQPLVENAIKHGLLPKQSAEGMVRIRIYEKDDLLYIEIEDNGVGLTHSLSSQNKLYKSFSLSNMQQRADHLRKIQKQAIYTTLKELTDEYGKVKGTLAIVTMELEAESAGPGVRR